MATESDPKTTHGDAVRDGGASSDRGGRDAGMPGTNPGADAMSHSGTNAHPSTTQQPSHPSEPPSTRGADDPDADPAKATDAGPTS